MMKQPSAKTVNSADQEERARQANGRMAERQARLRLPTFVRKVRSLSCLRLPVCSLPAFVRKVRSLSCLRRSCRTAKSFRPGSSPVFRSWSKRATTTHCQDHPPKPFALLRRSVALLPTLSRLQITARNLPLLFAPFPRFGRQRTRSSTIARSHKRSRAAIGGSRPTNPRLGGSPPRPSACSAPLRRGDVLRCARTSPQIKILGFKTKKEFFL
jgi:hypothetical protein